MDDHELLARLDERVEALRAEVGRMATEMGNCREAISGLKAAASRWGAVAGLVVTLLGAALVAGVQAWAKTGP